MVDFKKLMTPEQRAKWDEYRQFEQEQKDRYVSMTNKELKEAADYCLSNMQAPLRFGPGAPVYDSAFFHALLPELFKRLKTE